MDANLQLSQMRVSEALRALNEALADAHRLGLRTTVKASGDPEKQVARVVMMNPVEMEFQRESQ